MVNWFTARTIVEEAIVQTAVDRFSKRFTRFDEAFEALKWLLARKVETLDSAMRTVKGISYYLYRQGPDPLAGTPAIIVMYTYDADEVVLHDLKAEKSAPAEEEE